jgi:hypothetical protein
MRNRLLGLALTGCGSSLQTTLQKDWEASVGREARTINVDPQRGHLLVGKEKSTTIIDDNGQVIYGEEEEKGMFGQIASTVKERPRTSRTLRWRGCPFRRWRQTNPTT